MVRDMELWQGFLMITALMCLFAEALVAEPRLPLMRKALSFVPVQREVLMMQWRHILKESL